LLERRPGPREIAARDQRDQLPDLPRLQGHMSDPDFLDGEPRLARGAVPLGEADGGGVAGELPLFISEEDDVVLAFLVFAEFAEGFLKRPGIEIGDQRPEGGAVRVKTGDLAEMRLRQAMEAVDHVDIKIEER